jgi:hypothetical protein
MPTVFRAMKREDDGLPRVANSATGLGARDPKDADVVNGIVQVGDKGMSVNPSVGDIPLEFLPPRIDPAGWGANSNRMFRYGEGPFVQALLTPALELLPDGPDHGVVRPVAVVTLAQYRQDIVATRNGWVDLGI